MDKQKFLERYEELGEQGINGKERLQIINREFDKDYKTLDTLRHMVCRHKKNSVSQRVEGHGFEGQNWKHAWVKDDDASIFIKNPDFEEYSENLMEKFDEICSKYQYTKPDIITSRKKPEPYAMKVVVTDAHLGLDPGKGGSQLFQYEYGAEQYRKQMRGIFPSIMKEFKTYGKAEELILQDLGDREDGLAGLTTRGGHKLEQNMTDIEVFEMCIDAKLELLQSILQEDIADKIIIRDVVNSNHSSTFAHMVSLATKKLINAMYGDVVEVEILERYMEHKEYGDHCFILTHGKDAKHQFKGFPLQLNDKTINMINEYIDHYEIKSKYIHVEKGDLHQIGFNKIHKFDYRNYCAFSPPSQWVQHNFGACYSGYAIQMIPKHSNAISHTDYFIDYKKK